MRFSRGLIIMMPSSWITLSPAHVLGNVVWKLFSKKICGSLLLHFPVMTCWVSWNLLLWVQHLDLSFTCCERSVKFSLLKIYSPTDGQKTVANVKLLIALFQSCLISLEWLDSRGMISFGTWCAFELSVTRYTVIWLGQVVTDLMLHHSLSFYLSVSIKPIQQVGRTGKKKKHKIELSLCKWMERVYFYLPCCKPDFELNLLKHVLIMQLIALYLALFDCFVFQASNNSPSDCKKALSSGKHLSSVLLCIILLINV